MVIRVFTPLEVRSNGLGVVFVIMRNFQALQRFFLQIKHSGLVCAATSSIQRLPGALSAPRSLITRYGDMSI